MNPRDPYKEPSGVLRNRLGISDPAELAEYERDLAFFRVVELELSPLEGRFDFEHLRAIHRYILQDIFDWAGELRTVDTRALGIPHARTQRVFFDQMFRHAGWAVNWAGIDASAAHAARHMSVYGRPDYLADQLRHAVHPATELAEGRLATTLGNRSLLDSSAHFRAMRDHHRAAVMMPYGRTG
jgi:cell filamentation protein